ncbi:recombination mediator RecR [Patescibacteria group bacterium]|nr:recombination mediator RecR [Patescibacteria group bacterium]
MYPKLIQELIEDFTHFPGIGPRQAARFVFYLLKEDKMRVQNLAEKIKRLHEEIGFCKQCFASVTLGEGKLQMLCRSCADAKRDSRVIMVVEKEADLQNIEKTHSFNGMYHVLNGVISPLDSSGPAKLHIKELLMRVKNLLAEKKQVEMILATNPTTEGDTTALYLERTFSPLKIKITRLGRGLTTGSELEYSDPETIKNAFINRR